MTISSVKTGAIGDSLLAGNAAFIPTDFESIATFTATGGETSLTFSSIPSTYKHLQIRGIARDNGSGTSGSTGLLIRANADTGSNYAWHYLYGNGATPAAFGSATQTSSYIGTVARGGMTSGIFGVNTIDIHDYSSTTKNKTFRSFTGLDRNGAGEVYLWSGLWQSTSAITSITLLLDGNALAAGSVFSLYGIK